LHEDVCAKVRAGELQSDYGQRIFENAQRLTGISETKLRKLWDEWLINDGKTAPKCYANLPRIQKATVVVTRFAGEIRAFIIKQKLEGSVVEIPDLQKFLKETHEYDIPRNALRRALHKMGLKWGPKTKLMVR
jgi:hypothetical protein